MALGVFGVPHSRRRLHRFPTSPPNFDPHGGRQRFTAWVPIQPDLAGRNAYEVLGVPEDSSIAEIKASFRNLAKECHPDITPSASQRFLIVLAAYEVKHLHWYQIGDMVSTCECRCSRARLPSSKFWLFEPRCGLHDIGGWYIETFGRDKSGKTVSSQRQWDAAVEVHDKRLHPAMYLLTLAYRTLDIEVTKRRKQTLREIVRPKLHYVFQWCKKCLR